MEITLKELHRGVCKTFTALAIGKDESVFDFLKDLDKSNRQASKQLQNAMTTIASEPAYHNPRKFKSVGNGIFEIKTNSGIRLYTFLTQIEGLSEPQFVIATNGGTKNNAREQNRDIERARALKNAFDDSLASPKTKLKYLPLPA